MDLPGSGTLDGAAPPGGKPLESATDHPRPPEHIPYPAPTQPDQICEHFFMIERRAQ